MPGIYWHFVDVMWIVVYMTVYISVINPLRSEREAFRVLLYVIGVAAVVILLALLIQALF